MDDQTYQHAADDMFSRVEDMFVDVDADDVDVERSGGTITLTFRDKSKCVLNTQRPTRQLWLAAQARAWHFSFDAARGAWLDDKGQGDELLTTIRAIAARAGVRV